MHNLCQQETLDRASILCAVDNAELKLLQAEYLDRAKILTESATEFNRITEELGMFNQSDQRQKLEEIARFNKKEIHSEQERELKQLVFRFGLNSIAKYFVSPEEILARKLIQTVDNDRSLMLQIEEAKARSGIISTTEPYVRDTLKLKNKDFLLSIKDKDTYPTNTYTIKVKNKFAEYLKQLRIIADVTSTTEAKTEASTKAYSELKTICDIDGY